MSKYITIGTNKIEVTSIDVDTISKKVGGIKLTAVVPKTAIDDLGLTFSDIKGLFTSGEDISFYEDDTIISTHTNFCKDFAFKYSKENAEYTISVMKKSDAEILADMNQEDTMNAYTAIADLYEAKIAAMAE